MIVHVCKHCKKGFRHGWEWEYHSCPGYDAEKAQIEQMSNEELLDFILKRRQNTDTINEGDHT